MANFIERWFNPNADIPVVAMEVDEPTALLMENMQLESQGRQLKESMTDLMTYLEDLNWYRLDGWEEDRGFSIETIRENSDRIRALLTVNPTIKKAINARIGYIWGRGVSFEKGPTAKMLNNANNKTKIFNSTAHERLEKMLATDGNIWAAKDNTTEEVFFIPINQIAGWVLDERDPSRVNYWLRRYTVVVKNFNTGTEREKFIEVFYPAHDYTGGVVKSIENIPVDRNVQVVHTTANRQDGWILGIPDILAAMFWAKAHKELYESGTTYVKAQGKFASKVISKTRAGASTSAARLAEAPRRDPMSGEVLDTGGTAVLGGGLDLQLMGKMSGGVDFKAFDPVAGLVAVGLDIPLDVILGRTENDEKSLERTTVDAMQMRQKLWSEFYTNLFGRDTKVIWPKIRTEPEYRRIQALEITNKTGSLSRKEIRELTLEAYDIEGTADELPELEDNWAYMVAESLADAAAKRAADATVPEQGKDAGIGKLSTGDDAKASRDNKADTNTQNE